MHITSLLSFGVCAAGIANAAFSYTLKDTFNSTNFFQEFEFNDIPDPTHGFVKYIDMGTANKTNLAGLSKLASANVDFVYLGVDSTTMNPPAPGRASTRVTSNKNYTQGLFIADIGHMPVGCGTWPAWWTLGASGTWPASGEIDIIEGVNSQVGNIQTLHTSATCSLVNTNALPTSNQTHTDCNQDTGYTGCGVTVADTASFGAGFNAVGGGVNAMLWNSSSITFWNFHRASIPADITSGNPNPSSWGLPSANFQGSGCNINQHFMDHQIVFDTTFCGDWAGVASVWDSDPTCSKLAPTCQAYVAANPAAFKDAYWLINSVQVYQDATATASGTKRGVAFEG